MIAGPATTSTSSSSATRRCSTRSSWSTSTRTACCSVEGGAGCGRQTGPSSPARTRRLTPSESAQTDKSRYSVAVCRKSADFRTGSEYLAGTPSRLSGLAARDEPPAVPSERPPGRPQCVPDAVNTAIAAAIARGADSSPNRTAPTREGFAFTVRAERHQSTQASEPVTNRLGPMFSPTSSEKGCESGRADRSDAAGRLLTTTVVTAAYDRRWPTAQGARAARTDPTRHGRASQVPPQPRTARPAPATRARRENRPRPPARAASAKDYATTPTPNTGSAAFLSTTTSTAVREHRDQADSRRGRSTSPSKAASALSSRSGDAIARSRARSQAPTRHPRAPSCGRTRRHSCARVRARSGWGEV